MKDLDPRFLAVKEKRYLEGADAKILVERELDARRQTLRGDAIEVEDARQGAMDFVGMNFRLVVNPGLFDFSPRESHLGNLLPVLEEAQGLEIGILEKEPGDVFRIDGCEAVGLGEVDALHEQPGHHDGGIDSVHADVVGEFY